ncbi:hypothetical protein EEZ25_21770 [Micromonospora aurantiaca]|uniref:hypothetical protein n=1 Tax=Micromonospora aurantiaca (nom. illeg.) TaxID=47850 RepID=UPI000F3FA185|nr:hypothetical protein [Micromonospora aurantiaca]RNH99633.1 hypothetical protein EEZ25_21770 [Micromonospora aurantiaca]
MPTSTITAPPRRWAARLSAAAVAALVVIAGQVVVAAPAHAAGCRSSPYSAKLSAADPFMIYDGPDVISYPKYPSYYRTTSQCRDIQIRNLGDGDDWGPFDACVNFYGRATCNYWTHVPTGQWRNLATNVKDGTKFYIWIRIDPGRYYGFTAVGDW